MLDSIIESCMYVANNSIDVKINNNKIIEFIKLENEIKSSHWLSDSPYNLLDLSTEEIVNFLLIYESITFSFGEIQNGL